MRIVVSGGGTGGHIFPALALAQRLPEVIPGAELLYIGAKTGMETEIVPKQGVPFQAVTAKKLRKVLSPSTFGVMLSLVQGYREAKTYLRAFKADVVVGTGGYVAAAATLAGVSLRLPTLILAPDAIPGRTNRLLARYARRICVVFPETVSLFPAQKARVTGLPLRAGIVAPADVTPAKARERFAGLAPDRFTLLVVGGSQGARAVNNLILEAAPGLLEAGVQILHQVGPRNIEAVQAQVQAKPLGNRTGYCPLAFLDEGQMPLAFRAADLIVCRGGISSLSEVLANGLPALVIPLPTAYADHQTANARALATAGAALLCPEADLTPERLQTELLNLKATPTRLEKMRVASQTMGRPDATDAVCREILELR